MNFGRRIDEKSLDINKKYKNVGDSKEKHKEIKDFDNFPILGGKIENLYVLIHLAAL